MYAEKISRNNAIFKTSMPHFEYLMTFEKMDESKIGSLITMLNPIEIPTIKLSSITQCGHLAKILI